MVRLVRMREVDILLHPTHHNLFFFCDLLIASFETFLLDTSKGCNDTTPITRMLQHTRHRLPLLPLRRLAAIRKLQLGCGPARLRVFF